MLLCFADIEKSIQQINEQKRLLKTRKDFTKREFAVDEFDITEEYNSDEERKWRGILTVVLFVISLVSFITLTQCSYSAA